MPEIVEIKIMSDYINKLSDETFNEVVSVKNNNTDTETLINEKFKISSESNGKELKLILTNQKDEETEIYFFMGMSGNWKFIDKSKINETKHIRLMFNTKNHSLIVHGGYMGPKYSIGKKFNGVKRGPDPMKEFNKFKENILSNIDNKVFDGMICDVILNQKYFNGIGNYLRSTILYYLDVNPFSISRDVILKTKLLEFCRDIPIKSYQLNGGQLKDWKSPFDTDSSKFKEWVFYQKGISCKDKTNRTFWFDKKWESECPYKIKY